MKCGGCFRCHAQPSSHLYIHTYTQDGPLCTCGPPPRPLGSGPTEFTHTIPTLLHRMGRSVPAGLRLGLLAQARHHLSAFNAQELANTIWALSATSPPPPPLSDVVATRGGGNGVEPSRTSGFGTAGPSSLAGPAVAGPAAAGAVAAGPSGALSPDWVEAWCTSAQPRLLVVGGERGVQAGERPQGEAWCASAQPRLH